MKRRVLLYPGEDGFVVAEVPSLPGCISQGRTREDALDNVREAISLHDEIAAALNPSTLQVLFRRVSRKSGHKQKFALRPEAP